jgi:hypothetical protein
MTMEAANAAIRKVLEEMHLMEARLTEKISGCCDDVERWIDSPVEISPT